MRIIILCTAISLILGCSSTSEKKNTNWIEKSNKIAQYFTNSLSELYPELGSSLGYKQYDSKGSKYTDSIVDAELSIYKKWLSKINTLIAKESNKNLKVDYLILKDVINHSIEGLNNQKELSMVPFHNGTRDVYFYLVQLINPQSPQERKVAAISRFEEYVNPKDHKPLLLAYISQIKNVVASSKGKKTFAFKGEIEKYLSDSPNFVKGIKELLQSTKEKGWESNFNKFKSQAKAYDNFIKKEILPLAQKKPLLAKKVYIHKLKGVGVHSSPTEMIEVGKKEFQSLYKKFEQLAKKIAKKEKIKYTSPRKVIDHLKNEQVTDLKEVEKLYNRADLKLANIITKNDLVTLPSKSLIIRLAGDAESKA